jgi:hypothetical protein
MFNRLPFQAVLKGWMVAEAQEREPRKCGGYGR